MRVLALWVVATAAFAQQVPLTIDRNNTPPNGEINIDYPAPGGGGFQFTASGGLQPYTWTEVLNPDQTSNLPPGLTLFNDGTLGGPQGSGEEIPIAAGTYRFTVKVTGACPNCAGPPPTDQAAFTVQIFTPLTITSPAAIPSGTATQNYQYAFTGSGGDPNSYLWTLDVDAGFDATICGEFGIPPGLCLTRATGVLAGNPTTPGDYQFPLRLIDNHIGNGIDKTISIHVDVAPPVSNGLTLSGPLNLGTFILGASISGTLTAGGGNPPYTFVVAGVPAGMAASGSGISGTPTSPGNYSAGVTVTDSAGFKVTSGIVFSVFGIVPASLPSGVTSSFYSYFFSASGGTPPYSFSATGLPPQFSFSNGYLNGTPRAAGNFILAVTATDQAGHTYSASYPLAISAPPPLKVLSGALSDVNVLTPTSQTISASGGAPQYTWSLAGGALPDGFGLRPSGTVYGASAKTGSYTFSVRATDVTGASAIGSFTMNIKPAAVSIVTPSPLASGMIGVDYPTQVLTATGGIGPYTFSAPADALPAGLSLTPGGAISGTPARIGSTTFTVTATDSESQTGTASFTVKVRPFSPDLSLSAGSLGFTLASGALALPGSQTVDVQSTDVTKILSYSTAINGTPAWLSVSPGGKTPGSFSVALTPAALSLAASGTPYQAAVSVTCVSPSPCAGSIQTVAVLLTVAAIPPQLTVVTDELSFTTSPANPQTSSQTINVANTGGGSIGIVSITCPVSWCQAGAASSSLGGGQTGTITITADPTGLTGGYYYTAVTITTSAGVAVVPVTFFLAAKSSLGLDPAGAQLTMTAGGAAAAPNPTFLVNVAGSDTVAWTAAVLPGASWLTVVSGASGSSTGTAPGSVTFAIDPAASAALAAGAYYGTIRITSATAANSPQDFLVVLNVTAADKQKPQPAPAGLLFITSATPTLPPQTVQIFASSVNATAYQSAVETSDGGAWLAVSPTNGSASASAAGQGTVTVSPAGLKAGVYHGSVSYAFTAAAVRTVNVTLVVQTAVPAAGSALTNRAVAPNASPAPCTPTQLIPTQTGLVNNFAAPAAWPTPLEILLSSDCGTGVLNGQVVATFSNGDPPLALALSDATVGKYSGTWTPRNAGPQVTITAKATAPGLAAVTTQIAGSVVPNAAPVLTHNGTLHIFTPQVGAPLAPGTIVQIYGTALATQALPNTTIPLATSLGGTSVIIGGAVAPLFFVSPGQVNAEIPFELSPGQPYQVIVNNNGALSTPETIQSAAVAPGVAALPTGFANAQHVADASAVTDAAPAKPGEYVVIYLAGLGATTVPVASGAGAPSSPLAQAQDTPTVTLNSEAAPVLFAGLTPGLAGLYQIDLQIPADAPDGDLNLVVSQPGAAGVAVILPVHH